METNPHSPQTIVLGKSSRTATPLLSDVCSQSTIPTAYISMYIQLPRTFVIAPKQIQFGESILGYTCREMSTVCRVITKWVTHISTDINL